MGKLYVVSGPSGTGKGTLCKALLKARPDVVLSVSCATRAARPGEIEGVHYYFVSEDTFLSMRAAGGLLESAQINNGNWYGTPKAAVLDKLRQGKSVLLEIENNGAQQVIEQYPETISVFILPPDRATLIHRLVGRGTEDLIRLQARIRKVPSELAAARAYTSLVLNDDLQRATKKLIAVFDGNYRPDPDALETLHRLEIEFSDMDASLKALADCYNAR